MLLTTNDFVSRSMRCRKHKMETNGCLAAIFILWPFGFAMFVHLSGASHQAWHNWHYYAPIVVAIPFALRFFYLWLFAK